MTIDMLALSLLGLRFSCTLFNKFRSFFFYAEKLFRSFKLNIYIFAARLLQVLFRRKTYNFGATRPPYRAVAVMLSHIRYISS